MVRLGKVWVGDGEGTWGVGKLLDALYNSQKVNVAADMVAYNENDVIGEQEVERPRAP